MSTSHLVSERLLKAKKNGFRFDLLDEFPIKCCEFSSYLLAKFLIEKAGISSLKIVTGENRYERSQRHIWIKLDETDIDITANQFSSTDRTVIVEAHSQWHQRFIIINVEDPNPKLTQLNKEAKSTLLHDYKKILSCLAYSKNSVQTIHK